MALASRWLAVAAFVVVLSVVTAAPTQHSCTSVPLADNATGCGLTRAQIASILNIHNLARQSIAATGMNALSWSNALSADACLVVMSGGSNPGSSQYAHVTASTLSGPADPVATVNGWRSLGSYFTYVPSCAGSSSYCGTCNVSGPGSALAGCSQYAQMIWASTTQIGCALNNVPGGRGYFSCSYSPSGLTAGRPPYVASMTSVGCDASNSTKSSGGDDNKQPWWHYLLIAGGIIVAIGSGGTYFFLDDGCCTGGGDDGDNKRKKSARRGGRNVNSNRHADDYNDTLSHSLVDTV